MASEKITAIIDSVKELSVLELKELIDTYCEEFGVSGGAGPADGPVRQGFLPLQRGPAARPDPAGGRRLPGLCPEDGPVIIVIKDLGTKSNQPHRVPAKIPFECHYDSGLGNVVVMFCLLYTSRCV